ncbi:NeuD/PglB/VioB family sugar acetyltransferase [Actinacidiphila rubida]|uniref:Sugar O-acyltransferase, sialic acid O-acetyltransferase NeuD family n=1 Tax=Actinacidiphila rubida TaxID=310780 RepID=A0A1H8LQ42_9ACTN|nr:NeuD/PglB/VioB family sugar acetyltransferase [Actinacidiphila rubida]SEO07241.1 sugar O-acyltransferase, sialic acid O-acetyltransferase NeuD family [Actinacidiphila rubida]
MSGRSGPRDLLIAGAGGFARETAQAVAAAVAAGTQHWRLLGHLDDDPALHGRLVDGVTVLGGCELVHELPDAQVVLCVGSPRDHTGRARLVRRLGLPDERWGTVVHPSASVSASSEVGPGCVLLAHCVLTAAVRLGAHVAVMPHTVLTHDDEVADFATLASGVRLAGGVRVGRGAYLGSGALVRESTRVGAWSLVGMGSVVLRDVPPGEVWAGSPARRLRAAGAPERAELVAMTVAAGRAGHGPGTGRGERTEGAAPASHDGAAAEAGRIGPDDRDDQDDQDDQDNDTAGHGPAVRMGRSAR